MNLPQIPEKKYFTIGEVSKLCDIKPHVLRYWEKVFSQLKPNTRKGKRRYYQIHEIAFIREIRDLLYVQKFTINGAKRKVEAIKPDLIDTSDFSKNSKYMIDELREILIYLES